MTGRGDSPQPIDSLRLTRRRVLQLAVLGCAVQPLALACGGGRTVRAPAGPMGPRLAPVAVAPDRVIRQVVGLRPYRRLGFRVATERLGDTLVIHNYGHGGGGVSLSWGTARLAADQAAVTPHRSAAVLGCGAVGLASARLLQDAGFAVTIYARDLPPETTSNTAGAQWTPTTIGDASRRTADFDADFVRASEFAFRYFQNLVGARYGVWWRDNYFLSTAPTTGTPWEIELIGHLLPTQILDPTDHPFRTLHARRRRTMHVEPAIYLAAVLEDFRLAGGRVVVREFGDRNAITALDEPLVVNCTGLGAGALFGDADVMPIKGQLTVLVPQPEVDYITIGPGPGSLYMMPRQDGIVLGGTHGRGEASLDVNEVEADRIMSGHRRLFALMR
jgi:glycine/D-amino acid oxidase-like deaminating enzyme